MLKVYHKWCGKIIRGIQRLGFSFYYSLVFRRRVTVTGNVLIPNPFDIEIGKNVVIQKGVVLSSEIPGGKLLIGDNVNIGVKTKIDYSGSVTLNDNVLISENCTIYTHSHGHNPRSVPVGSELHIESNVWIGSTSIIMESCKKIGANSIVAARSLVLKDVDKNQRFINRFKC